MDPVTATHGAPCLAADASLFYIAFVKGQRRQLGVEEGQYLTMLLPFVETLLNATTAANYDYCHDPANFEASPEQIYVAFRAEMDDTQAARLPDGMLLNPWCVGEVTSFVASLVILREILDIALQNVLPRLMHLSAWLFRAQPSFIRTRILSGRHNSHSGQPAAGRDGGNACDDIRCDGYYRMQLEREDWRGVLIEYNELVIGIGVHAAHHERACSPHGMQATPCVDPQGTSSSLRPRFRSLRWLYT